MATQEKYYLIRSGEDGTSIREVDREKLLKDIAPNEDGETEYGPNLTFLSAIPDADKGYWRVQSENPAILIKGIIIVPKPKTIVQTFDIP